MRNSLKLFFVFAALACIMPVLAKDPVKPIAAESSSKKAMLPSATISVNATRFCVNGAAPQITFQGFGDTAPYTFTYNIVDQNGAVSQNFQAFQNPNDPISDTYVWGNFPMGVPGTFTVNLVSVQGQTSADQPVTGSVTFTIEQPASINFNFTNNICGSYGVPFAVTGLGSDTYTYVWNFGDSTTDTVGPTTNHAYTSGGSVGDGTVSYFAFVQVTNTANGCVSTSPINTVVVKQNPDTTLSGTFTKCGVGGGATTEIQFGNGAIGSTNTSYSFNWGDSSPTQMVASFTSLSHYYAPGQYNVTFQVTGTNGCVNAQTYQVFIGNEPTISLNLIGSSQICAPNAITVKASGFESNDPATVYRINWGLGTDNMQTVTAAELASNISHNYNNSSCGSTYTISSSLSYPDAIGVYITAYNQCSLSPNGSASIVGPIYISTPPQANFNLPGVVDPLATTTTACINAPVIMANTTTGGDYIETGGACSGNYKKVWKITPNTYTGVTNAQLGTDLGGSTTTSLWTSGANTISPSFTQPGTYNITLKVGNGCGITQITKTVCVQSVPTVGFNLDTNTGCFPLTVNATNTTSVTSPCPSGVSYLWDVSFTPNAFCGPVSEYSFVNGTTNVTPAGVSIKFTKPGTYNLRVTAQSACSSSPAQNVVRQIIVKGKPDVRIAQIPTVCQNGTNTTFTPTATVTNCGTQALTYSWSFPGAVSPTTSTQLAPGAVNYGSATGTNFSMSLSATNECGLTTTNSNTFAINPTPIVTTINGSASLNSITMCAGAQSPQIDFVSNITGATFNWVNGNTAIPTGLAANGTGSIMPFNITYTGSTVVTIPITVTPIDPAGCQGTPRTFNIVINPKPVFSTTPVDVSVCTGATANPYNISTYTNISANVNYSWTATVVNPSTGVSSFGMDMTGNAPTIPSYVASNTSSVPVLIANVNLTAAYTGCSVTSSSNFTIRVLQKPSITQTPNIVACRGNAIPDIVLQATPVNNWSWSTSPSGTNIGMSAASGNTTTNLISGFTASAAGTVTVTAIARHYQCIADTPMTFSITVNDIPDVITASIPNQQVCSNAQTSIVSLNTNVPGSTFNWSAVQPTGVTGATLTGTTPTLPGDVVSNATYNPLDIVYTITATSPLGCPGNVPFTYITTVKPIPHVATNFVNNNICSGSVFSISPADGGGNRIPAGTLYAWNAPTVTPASTITGGSSNTGTASFSQTLTNISDNSSLVHYSIIPSLNGCNGQPFNADVTVYPQPRLVFSDTDMTQKVCTSSSSTAVNITSPTQGNVQISWTLVHDGTNPTDVTLLSGAALPASGSGDIPSLSLINNTTSLRTLTFTVTASVNNASSAICNSVTYTYTIQVTPVITVSYVKYQYAGGFNISTNGGTNGAINLIVSGGSGNYTFNWTSSNNSFNNGNPYTQEDINWVGNVPVISIAAPAGIYSVTVNDAQNIGCQPYTEGNIIMTQPLPFLIASGPITDVNCSGASTGCIKVDITSASIAPFTYQWYTAGTNTLIGTIQDNTPTGYNICNLPAGSYDVKVTDFAGVTRTLTGLVINQPTPITYTVTSNNISCFSVLDGGITIDATGGTGALTYTWTPTSASNTNVATGLAPGTYTCVIKDANNCTKSTGSITITQPNPITINTTALTNALCFDSATGSATVSAVGGTGALTYNWSNNASGPSITAVPAGSYVVTVKDQNNCQNTRTVIINEPTQLVATATATALNCYGENTATATATVTGGTPPYFYNWNSPIPQNTQVATGLPAGSYTVLVRDANNCNPLSNPTVVISQPAQLKFDIATPSAILCNQGTTSVTVNITQPTQTNYTYTLQGTNANDNSSVALQDVITNLSNTFNNIPAGTFTITVKDGLGCSGISTITQPLVIGQPTAITATSTITDITCVGNNNASIVVAANGGTPFSPPASAYQVTWYNTTSGTPVLLSGNALTQTNLSPGTYQYQVKDANGCLSAIGTQQIQQAANFTVNPTVTQIGCSGGADGQISLGVSGGASPFTFTWQGNTTTVNAIPNNFTGLAAGVYCYSIVDARGCKPTDAVTGNIVNTDCRTIVTPLPISLSHVPTNATDCTNPQSGAINLIVSGGTPAYTYQWTNGAITEDLAGIDAGTYGVHVVDSRGCTKDATFVITRPQPLYLDIQQNLSIDCDNYNVTQSFTAVSSGGLTPYTYSWSNQLDAGVVISNLGTTMSTPNSGAIQLTLTDAAGCSTSFTYNVFVPVMRDSAGNRIEPSHNATSYALATYGEYSVQDPIQFTNTTAGSYLSVAWDFGDGVTSTDDSPIHSYTRAGVYTVQQTIYYPMGCQHTKTFTYVVGDGYKLIVPTAFTANKDGINDVFIPVGVGVVNMRLEVYDSWGNMLYAEEGATIGGWDGLVNDKEAQVGNYQYKVSAVTFYGKTINQEGSFAKLK